MKIARLLANKLLHLAEMMRGRGDWRLELQPFDCTGNWILIMTQVFIFSRQSCRPISKLEGVVVYTEMRLVAWSPLRAGLKCVRVLEWIIEKIILNQKYQILCIFVKEGAYAPYAPNYCMSTILVILLWVPFTRNIQQVQKIKYSNITIYQS